MQMSFNIFDISYEYYSMIESIIRATIMQFVKYYRSTAKLDLPIMFLSLSLDKEAKKFLSK